MRGKYIDTVGRYEGMHRQEGRQTRTSYQGKGGKSGGREGEGRRKAGRSTEEERENSIDYHPLE